MAKFKRLNRFLERIGLKRKKKESDHIDLAASSSRGWRRLWSRRSEKGTPLLQPSVTNDSRISRLLRRLRVRPKSKVCDNAGVSKELVDSVVDDNNFVLPCSSSTEQSTNIIIAPPHRQNESGPTTTLMFHTKVFGQLETISEWTEVSDTLSITTWTSSTPSDLTSVTELIDDEDDSSSTVSLTSIEEFYSITDTHTHCNACRNEDTEYHQPTEWELLGCYHKHKEIVRDNEAQSNMMDDQIIVFLPVIVMITLGLLLMVKLLFIIW